MSRIRMAHTCLPRDIFAQTATVTIANTAAETSMIGSGVGRTLISSRFFFPGRTLRYKMKGYVSALNGVTATLRIKLGSVVLVESVGTHVSITQVEFDVEFDMVCREEGESGLIIGQGRSLVAGGQGFSTVAMRGLMMTSPATVNTLAAQQFAATYQWGAADPGNSLVITNLSLEIEH